MIDAELAGAGYSISIYDKLYGYTLIGRSVCVAAFGGRALVLTHEAAPLHHLNGASSPFGLRSLTRAHFRTR